MLSSWQHCKNKKSVKIELMKVDHEHVNKENKKNTMYENKTIWIIKRVLAHARGRSMTNCRCVSLHPTFSVCSESARSEHCAWKYAIAPNQRRFDNVRQRQLINPRPKFLCHVILSAQVIVFIVHPRGIPVPIYHFHLYCKTTSLKW